MDVELREVSREGEGASYGRGFAARVGRPPLVALPVSWSFLDDTEGACKLVSC